jgi:DNA-binding response OmpR family regulator
LVVDDDEWMRLYLASILRSARYEVDVVDSAEAALRLLRVGSYDILLTDYLMPGMDGRALCQRVRGEFADDAPYIVMLTVKHTGADRDAGLSSGADEYIVKGSPTSEILAKLHGGRTPLRRSSAPLQPRFHTPLRRSSAPLQPRFHMPLRAADAARSRANIAQWNSYLLSACVRSMVRMGWDYTT